MKLLIAAQKEKKELKELEGKKDDMSD